MTKFTPRGYPVPDDYAQPADVPAALDDLATAVDSDVQGVANNLAGHNHDSRYYTEAEVDGLLAGKEPADGQIAKFATSLASTTDRRLYALVWDVGTLGPDSEKTSPLYTVPAGCYVVASVQHFSNYLNVVVDFVSTTQFNLQCRNSTNNTTHDNIKVHAIVVNL